MQKEDLKIGQSVTFKCNDGTTKDGVFKGAVDYGGDVQATVEYIATTTTTVNLEDVTLK
ncbi:hypothetical protein [Clostridium tyrobutyricum]|uniref:hypothetical protein n=1 Tax=Clostridium tyrobutyricum TaxID=1519 RepID=UPI001C381156|nr:hypothetical protein [Clostridium tyrobutyricum]MBV4427167.1 hypothetical protein [Clostridium tyrobutyricum]MBV4442498.1 hypothetical protein [Clostridium tyrobutyricum]